MRASSKPVDGERFVGNGERFVGRERTRLLHRRHVPEEDT
jgi:hypothetical protein